MSYDPVLMRHFPATPRWWLLVTPALDQRPCASFSPDDLRAAAQWCARHDYLGAELPPEPREPVSA